MLLTSPPRWPCAGLLRRRVWRESALALGHPKLVTWKRGRAQRTGWKTKTKSHICGNKCCEMNCVWFRIWPLNSEGPAKLQVHSWAATLSNFSEKMWADCCVLHVLLQSLYLLGFFTEKTWNSKSHSKGRRSSVSEFQDGCVPVLCTPACLQQHWLM